jgi:hypothetical protein
MNATSQKALIMSEEEMRAFVNDRITPVKERDSILEDRAILNQLADRVKKELDRESGSTLESGNLK